LSLCVSRGSGPPLTSPYTPSNQQNHAAQIHVKDAKDHVGKICVQKKMCAKKKNACQEKKIVKQKYVWRKKCVSRKNVCQQCNVCQKKGVSRKRMCVTPNQKNLKKLRHRDLRHTKNEIMQQIYVEAAKDQMCVTHRKRNLKKLRRVEGCTPIQSRTATHCSPSMYKTQNTKLASHTKKKIQRNPDI